MAGLLVVFLAVVPLAAMAAAGKVDLSGMLTHTFRLEQWREAFTVLAEQEASGAIKVAFDFR